MLAGAASTSLTSLSGCVDGRGVLGGRRSGTVTLEYVEVAGARSESTFQVVVDRLNDRFDREIDLQFTEVPYANLKSQLQTRVGGGNPPDVAAIDQIWIGEFVDAGALLALDEVGDDVDLDDYLDPFLAAARSDGHLYAIPTTTDVRGLYWNKRAFADAGLDPESPPETWSEFFRAARALHDPPRRYGAAYFVVGGRWTVSLFSAGGALVSEDGTEPRFHEQPGVEAAAFVDRLYNEAAVGPPNPPYQDGAQVAREFLTGQYAMTVVEGSWLDYFWRNLGNANDELLDRFGFAPTPHPASGRPATMSGGHLWAGFADTDHPDVVREFVRIAAGREFKRHLAIESGQIPTRASLQDDAAIWDEILYADAVRDLLGSTHLRPVRNWSVVATELDPALQRIAFGDAEPRDALETAAENVRTTLG